MLSDLGYRPTAGAYDEAVDVGGALRASWNLLGRVLGQVQPGELAQRQRLLDRLLDAEGAGHLVEDRRQQIRPWTLDPLPLILDGEEFHHLAAGAAQRARVHEALLADLHGERTVLRAGVLSPAVVYSQTCVHTTMASHRPPRWLVHYAVDVVRTAEGVWKVLADHTDAPTGLAAALINRSIMARVFPDATRLAGVAPVASTLGDLRRALATLAPSDRRSPRTVVLSPGTGDAHYVEHSSLAVQMGFHLVQGGDLVVRQQRVWLRALDGLEPVDIVYRTVTDEGLDPLAARAQGAAGVPAISWAAQAGGVVLANARGSRLAQEPALTASLDAVTEVLTGEVLTLPTWQVGEPLATAPVYQHAQHRVIEGHVVLRLHVTVDADGANVMPGASCRVVRHGDDPRHGDDSTNKDVWVVGHASNVRSPVRVIPPQQVDFAGSLPKRAADALYWLGRATERAEVAARTARTLGGQLEHDPSLPTFAQGQWALGAIALARAARSLPPTTNDDTAWPLQERLRRELEAVSPFVGTQLVTLVQEAASVREYLSSTTARVLGRLAHERADLLGRHADVDELDAVLVDLAALAGLATESTVRGPAWRLMDLGRRLERALAVLGSVEAALGPATDTFALQPLSESVLAANESLIAYRRRHRSDVELDTVVAFLLHDDTNPRALAFQLDRLREHMAALSWPEGADLVHQASMGSFHHDAGTVVGGRRLGIDAVVLGVRGPLLNLGDSIVERWFADPVDPMVMGPARVR
jgi:uncharacterized circularly permuted ATP-grasp superfamily protein/uncharacterized alpha-E superfamily protein